MGNLLRHVGNIVAGPRTKWITLVVWIVLVTGLTIIFPAVNREETNNASNLPNSAWSVQASHVNKQMWPSKNGDPALIVWYRKSGLTNTDLQEAQSVAKKFVDKPLKDESSVTPSGNLPLSVWKSMESTDGTTLVETVLLKPHLSDQDTAKAVKKIRSRLSTVVGDKALTNTTLTSAGLHIRVTGPAGIASDTLALFANINGVLLVSTVLLVLILLMLLYRSPLLAIIPLIGVGFAYGVISPILGVLAKSGFIVVDAESISIMTVLLFGAGTDYCLFLVARFRERLYASRNHHEGMISALGGTTGAIGMSALTVVISLLSLLTTRLGSFHRFAVPFSVAILIMAIAGLTLVPALLSIFGRASFYPFVPRTPEMEMERQQTKGRKVAKVRLLRTRAGHKQGSPQVGRVSRWMGRLVATKPWPILVTALVAIGTLAAFAPQMKETYNPLSQLPQSMASRQGFTLLAEHYSPGSVAPVNVIVQTDGKHVAMGKTLKKLSFVSMVGVPEASQINQKYERISVTLKADPYTLKSISEIPILRKTAETVLANTGIHNSDKHVWIGGQTAEQYDTRQLTDRDMHIVMPLVIGIIAVLLLAYLRSVVAMVYLVGTVLLSFFGSLGAGWLFLHDVLHKNALQGGISLYAFIFLVALGEDYNIFMVSRIREEWRRRSVREAIAEGVSRTGGVITSAGLILAGTFAVLTSMPGDILIDFGTITAFGVLLDTFIVRPLLVPAIMAIVDRYSFWPSSTRDARASENM